MGWDGAAPAVRWTDWAVIDRPLHKGAPWIRQSDADDDERDWQQLVQTLKWRPQPMGMTQERVTAAMRQDRRNPRVMRLLLVSRRALCGSFLETGAARDGNAIDSQRPRPLLFSHRQ